MNLFLNLDDNGFGDLLGGRNWAGVEGFVDEWRVISACLRNGTDASFKRCAVRFENGAALLYSPRNTISDRDAIRVPADEVGALADEIVGAIERWEAA